TRHGRQKPSQQTRRREMHHSTTETRNVEALGRRRNRYGVARARGTGAGVWDVLVSFIDQIGMDFIGDDDQTVLLGNLADGGQLFATQEAPRGIMRMAQQQ